jgi:carboxyl-terminal processing protease
MLFVAGSVAAIVGLTALKGPVLAPGRDPATKALSIFTDVLRLTRSNYVEPVDTPVLLSGAYDGVTDAIDPFSFYIPPEKMVVYRAFAASHAPSTGLVLGRRSGYTFVVAPVPGSPAEAAGVRPGDIIISVDGSTTRNAALWEVESRLAGPTGSTAKVKVLRGGDERDTEISIARRAYDPPAASDRRQEGVEIVRIPYFEKGSSTRIRKAVEAQSASGDLIVDVRDSAGGEVDEAVAAASLFVPEGEVARLAAKKIPEKTYRSSTPPIRKGTIFVLVDSGTAGPAEVFAGALRDRANATLVGEPTAGMGIVQRLIPMTSGGALYMTVGRYVTPSGTELAGKGLKPGVTVDVFPEDRTDKSDPVLRKALELARGTSAKAAA